MFVPTRSTWRFVFGDGTVIEDSSDSPEGLSDMLKRVEGIHGNGVLHQDGPNSGYVVESAVRFEIEETSTPRRTP